MDLFKPSCLHHDLIDCSKEFLELETHVKYTEAMDA
jgi:hypothetical protein